MRKNKMENIIKTNGFKTNLYAIFLTVPMNKENVTINSLVPAVLRRGTKKYPNQLEINKKLEEMYGASFNCGVDKMGDYQVLKFYMEVLSNKYLPEKQNAVEFLKELVFNPALENGAFKKEYVDQEKENIRKIIESRKDNKARFALDRCIEEMFEGEAYGIFKFGKVEDLEKINEKNLYSQYQKLIKEARIDCFSCGEEVENIDLQIRDKDKKEYKCELEKHSIKNKEIKEPMDVTQGKLIIGLDVPEGERSVISVYNTILGGGANSKLFQNVREKASLAYSASSSYIRRKNAIFIKTGIETENYEKALDIIKKQLEEMKNGNITDDEFDSGKKLIISNLNLISESQEDLIAYYFDQKLYDENLKLEEYIEKIKQVTKQEVIDLAKEVKLDTIYFLCGKEKEKGE